MWIMEDDDCEEASARGDALHRQIERARHTAQDAYRTARWLVFDHLPPGPVDEALLDERQRKALVVWRRAEHALDCLRHTAHRRRYGPAHRVIDVDAGRSLTGLGPASPMTRQS